MQKNSGEKNKGRVLLKTNFDLNVAAKSRQHHAGWWALSTLLIIVLLICFGYFITQSCSLSSQNSEDGTEHLSTEKK